MAVALVSPPTGTNVFSVFGDIGGMRHDDMTDMQQFDWVTGVSGDPKIYGRIYIMARGLIYRDPATP